MTDFNAIHIALLVAHIGQFVVLFYLYATGRPWHFAAFIALTTAIWLRP
jgi:hypothetical protein